MEKETDIHDENMEEREKKSLLDRLRSMMNPEEPIKEDKSEKSSDSSDTLEKPDPKDSEIERLRKELAEARGAVEQARAEGDKAGRNARIEELLVREPSDGLPAPSATPASRTALDSIFALAAGAR